MHCYVWLAVHIIIFDLYVLSIPISLANSMSATTGQWFMTDVTSELLLSHMTYRVPYL